MRSSKGRLVPAPDDHSDQGRGVTSPEKLEGPAATLRMAVKVVEHRDAGPADTTTLAK